MKWQWGCGQNWSTTTLNKLRPRQNSRHFADEIFQSIFLNENVCISLTISLKFVPKFLNIPALVHIMAWCEPGDKPLSEPMMVSLLMHIHVTRPEWVNETQWRRNVCILLGSTLCVYGMMRHIDNTMLSYFQYANTFILKYEELFDNGSGSAVIYRLMYLQPPYINFYTNQFRMILRILPKRSRALLNLSCCKMQFTFFGTTPYHCFWEITQPYRTTTIIHTFRIYIISYDGISMPFTVCSVTAAIFTDFAWRK